MYSLKWICISFICSVLIISCIHNKDWTDTGYYKGHNMQLWLMPDSSMQLKLHGLTYKNVYKGRWSSDDRYIIIDFPEDTTVFDPKDISRYLSTTLSMQTIIIEKESRKRLKWRNKGYLRKIEEHEDRCN